MKLIFRIAKTELATLFYSPIAWFILIIFSFLTGMQFAKSFDAIVTSFELGRLGTSTSITYNVFGSNWGFFAKIQSNLYMFIPLLTMSLLSREYASGSIKLLYSSPVNSLQITFGKYLSSMVYGLILLGLPILTMIYTSFFIPNFDFPVALTALLGLYLLICAYASIGLFMSSLTSYQVVAAIATLAVLTILKFVGGIGQEYDLIRDITYWLSINGRAGNMINGLIGSEDIIYFVVVVALFLSLTILKLSLSKSSLSTAGKALRYMGVAIVALSIGYISSRPQMKSFYDTTRTKTLTITKNSQDIMSKLDGKMTITHYVNLFDNNGSSYLPSQRQWGEQVFNKYLWFKSDLKIKYVYYWDVIPGEDPLVKYKKDTITDVVEYLANIYRLSPKWFKTPEQIKKIVDLTPFDNKFIRIVERENGQIAYLRDYNDMMRTPGEAEISAAFKKMVVSPPVVGFLGGHDERSIDKAGDKDYLLFANAPTFRYSLLNQGYDVSTVNVSDDQNIPADINILVIADLRVPFNEEEMAKIKEYINRGGSMMILSEPGRESLMKPLLDIFGVEMMQGTIAHPSEDFYINLVLAEVTPEGAELNFGFKTMLAKNMKVAMPGAGALKYRNIEGYKITPLFVTRSENVWIELETEDLLEDNVEFNEKAGEVEGPFVAGIALERMMNGIGQRILVLGDADCISNSEMKMQRNGYRSGNFDLATESFRWLSDGQFPIDIRRPHPIDNELKATVNSISFTKILFMLIYPGSLLVIALAINVIRRKY